jgi:VWFA-related protein
MAIGVVAILVLQQAAPPTFKSAVDLVAVDVHVVDKNGNPITDLRPEDFEVQIGGKKQRVASAALVSYTSGAPAAAGSSVVGNTNPSSHESASPRPQRTFILAIDEHSLHVSNALAAVNAAGRFIDRLQPDDLVGLQAYPTGSAHHDLTTDHAAVRLAVGKITGLFQEPSSKFRLTPSEAIDIASGDGDSMMAVMKRECPSMRCDQNGIRNEAISLAGSIEMRVSQSVGGLRGLVRSVENIPGRKMLILVSGGLISTDRGMGRANAVGEIAQLGREAAQANVAIFALHLDWSFIESLASRGGLRTSYFRDSNMAAAGLETIAGTAGGAVFRVYGTSPDAAFERVLRETSAHYLLGVDAGTVDGDGQARAIRVRVKRGGAQVRSRTSVIMPRAGSQMK